jgi:hypothetical protein
LKTHSLIIEEFPTILGKRCKFEFDEEDSHKEKLLEEELLEEELLEDDESVKKLRSCLKMMMSCL